MYSLNAKKAQIHLVATIWHVPVASTMRVAREHADTAITAVSGPGATRIYIYPTGRAPAAQMICDAQSRLHKIASAQLKLA